MTAKKVLVKNLTTCVTTQETVNISELAGVTIINPVTDAEYEAGLICQMNDNVKALWQAAHDYEYAEISGSAIGLIVLGNLSSKPKCIAVQTWISSIWTLYYTRKPLVTYTWNNTLYDFSSCGSCPHTCTELMEELGF